MNYTYKLPVSTLVSIYSRNRDFVFPRSSVGENDIPVFFQFYASKNDGKNMELLFPRPQNIFKTAFPDLKHPVKTQENKKLRKTP